MKKSPTKSKPKRIPKRALKNAYPANPKERGEWVELLFMATAARMGLKVMRPHGDSARFDVVVEDHEGKLLRVQVKSTTYKRNNRYQCLCMWSATTLRLGSARLGGPSTGVLRRGHPKQYSKDQIDFIAAYVVPEDAWFIVPVGEVRTKGFYLPPRDKPGRNRYAQFLDAWHLLGADGSGLTIHASAESDLLLQFLKAKVAEESGQQVSG